MPKRIVQGTVVSAPKNKTISVLVERQIMHPVYKKYIKKSKKYAAHDEHNTANVGDIVRVIESRPISKTKRWVLLGNTAAAE
jgi:small subunit ribosomal protein S17